MPSANPPASCRPAAACPRDKAGPAGLRHWGTGRPSPHGAGLRLGMAAQPWEEVSPWASPQAEHGGGMEPCGQCVIPGETLQLRREPLPAAEAGHRDSHVPLRRAGTASRARDDASAHVPSGER